MKKLKMDEIEKIFQFFKSFKIKQMVINRKRTKFKRKPNWRASLKNWMIWRGIEGERKKREEIKRLSVPNQWYVNHTCCLGTEGTLSTFQRRPRKLVFGQWVMPHVLPEARRLNCTRQSLFLIIFIFIKLPNHPSIPVIIKKKW